MFTWYENSYHVEVDGPYGPRTIGARNQIVLPAELMSEVGLSPDDKVIITLNPDIPGTLLVIPARLVASAFHYTLDALRTQDPAS